MSFAQLGDRDPLLVFNFTSTSLEALESSMEAATASSSWTLWSSRLLHQHHLLFGVFLKKQTLVFILHPV